MPEETSEASRQWDNEIQPRTSPVSGTPRRSEGPETQTQTQTHAMARSHLDPIESSAAQGFLSSPALNETLEHLLQEDEDELLLPSPVAASGSGCWRHDAAYERWRKEAKLSRRRERRALAERKRVKGRQLGVEGMKHQLQELQKQYELLCKVADQKRQSLKALAAPMPPPPPPLLKGDLGDDQQRDQEAIAVSTLFPPQGSFTFLAEEMQRLQHENAYYRDMLEHKEHVRYMMNTVVEEMGLHVARPITRLNDESRNLCYMPFTVDQCYAIIRKDYEENIVRRAEFFNMKSNRKFALGWTGFASIESGTLLHLHQTKVWPVHPDESFGLTWKLFNIPTAYKQASSKARSVEILQKVSDDIAIFRRVTENMLTGCVNHSVYLMYRMRMGDAYVVGSVPLPLWGNGLSVRLGDPYGKSLLREGESLVLPQMYGIYEPVAPEPASVDEDAPPPPPTTTPSLVHTRIRRWGSYKCENASDTEFWANEMFEVMFRFEYLLS